MNDSRIVSWYTVDGDNRISAVCPEWDEMAEGQGSKLTSVHVLGMPLSRFISGDVTLMYTETLLQSVRLTHNQRTLQYRCDTPWTERQLGMVLRPGPSGQVRIDHTLLSVRPRSKALHFHAWHQIGAGVEHIPQRCSVCLWVQQAPHLPWRAPDQLQLGSMVVRYTVCSRCRAEEEMLRLQHAAET